MPVKHVSRFTSVWWFEQPPFSRLQGSMIEAQDLFEFHGETPPAVFRPATVRRMVGDKPGRHLARTPVGGIGGEKNVAPTEFPVDYLVVVEDLPGFPGSKLVGAQR
jgi:hypothetical protein